MVSEHHFTLDWCILLYGVWRSAKEKLQNNRPSIKGTEHIALGSITNILMMKHSCIAIVIILVHDMYYNRITV